MLIGNRVPRHFFVTSGIGESDITIHAGSYHLALRDAGIEMANQIVYSSILPGTAERVDHPIGGGRPITHGEVMETIAAVATCEYGDTATAGLIWGWLYEPQSAVRYGGLVCEYNGSYDEGQTRHHLREMLNELHTNGYEHFDLRDINYLVRSVTPEKMYGTALAAICFTSYDYPVLEEA